MPKTNQDYWRRKIGRNIERDKTHLEQLEAQGWSVFVVWECETKDLTKLREALVQFLS